MIHLDFRPSASKARLRQAAKPLCCGAVVLSTLLFFALSSPGLGQSRGGSVVDGAGITNTNPQYYVKLPVGGPVTNTFSTLETRVHRLLLPSVTSTWTSCTFRGVCLDFVVPAGGGAVNGTGATVADAQDLDGDGQPRIVPPNEDAISAAIIEGAQTDLFQGAVRGALQETFLWLLNVGNPPGQPTHSVGMVRAPSADGYIEVVDTSFNAARPQRFMAGPSYDIISASVDASSASTLGVAIELAADPGLAPESTSALNYTPTYSFLIDADGNASSGNRNGFDTVYSIFFSNGQLQTSREIWNGSYFQFAGAQGFPVSRTGPTLLAEIPASGRSDDFRWSVLSGLVVNPNLVNQRWFAQIDVTALAGASPFSTPSGSGSVVATASQVPANAVVSSAPLGTPTAAAWEETVGGQTMVFGGFFDSSGNPLAGSPFTLESLASGPQGLPSVGWINSNRAIFVWSHQGPFPRPEGTAGRANGSNVVSRFFGPDAQPQGAAQSVSVGDPGESLNPQVSVDGAGNVTITWQDSDQLRGRRLNPQGAPAGPTFDLASGAGVEQLVTASSPSGTLSSAWLSGDSLFLALYADDGSELVAPFVVAQQATAPDIAVSASGSTVLVWEAAGIGRDVLYQRFTASGSPAGPAISASEDSVGDQRTPAVGMNDSGESVVVWEESGRIEARFFDRAGGAVSVDATVDDASQGMATSPDASLGSDDGATVVYTRDTGSGSTELITFRLEADLGSGVCSPTETVFCGLGGRFGVTVNWRDQFGNSGSGQAVPLTSDTGYFWFFSQENVELVVKVLDGCGVNDSYWVFAGGLTDVEATIVVEDSVTGRTRTYFNPLKTPFAPIQDTSAFAGCTGSRVTSAPAVRSPGEAWADLLADLGASRSEVAAASPLLTRPSLSVSKACDDAGVLCLNDDRFEVEVDWATRNSSGTGQPVPLTSDTGYFWFFDEANVELVIKVLDACAINGNYWVFAGGLTDQEATIRVTDTVSGDVKTYSNPRGRKFAPVQDTSAFGTCP